ncbi:MAG TPA: TetR/AcrR family transcriptional regulator [Anaeromyxobacteraceae bacterium]
MEAVRAAPEPKKDGYHHGDLRNALLVTALRLVSERGPEGFSLREAAREVGVSPGAAYRHFTDRAALLAALAADGHVRLAEAMERALSHVPGAPGSRARTVASLLALGGAYVEFAVAHAPHFQVMFGPCQDAEASPCSAVTGRDAFGILVDALDGLVRAGAVTPEARAGAEITVWSAVHGLATLQVDGALAFAPAERAAAVRNVARLLLAGMGCPRELLPAAPAIDVDPRPPAHKERGK